MNLVGFNSFEVVCYQMGSTIQKVLFTFCWIQFHIAEFITKHSAYPKKKPLKPIYSTERPSKTIKIKINDNNNFITQEHRNKLNEKSIMTAVSAAWHSTYENFINKWKDCRVCSWRNNKIEWARVSNN